MQLLDNTTTQSSKVKTNNWSEINDDAYGIYDTNSHMKFKYAMLKSILCDYSD